MRIRAYVIDVKYYDFELDQEDIENIWTQDLDNDIDEEVDEDLVMEYLENHLEDYSTRDVNTVDSSCVFTDNDNKVLKTSPFMDSRYEKYIDK